MGSLIAGVLLGLAGDATPRTPSAPVEIGTSGPRHVVSETGSWQVLVVMFALVLVLGAAVLMYMVRQRARVLERRRVRRMGEAAALIAARDEAAAVRSTSAASSAPPRTTPARRRRPARNA